MLLLLTQLVEDCGFVALHFDVDDEEDKMLLKQQRKFINLMEEFHTEVSRQHVHAPVPISNSQAM